MQPGLVTFQMHEASQEECRTAHTVCCSDTGTTLQHHTAPMSITPSHSVMMHIWHQQNMRRKIVQVTSSSRLLTAQCRLYDSFRELSTQTDLLLAACGG